MFSCKIVKIPFDYIKEYDFQCFVYLVKIKNKVGNKKSLKRTSNILNWSLDNKQTDNNSDGHNDRFYHKFTPKSKHTRNRDLFVITKTMIKFEDLRENKTTKNTAKS